MNITVIGGRGFIGARLVNTLEATGATVHVSSTADGTGISPETGLLPENFEFPAGTQCVVYLAQSPHFRAMPEQASHLLSVNCLSVVRAAVAARRAGITRFVYVSTGTVYAPSFAALTEEAPLNRKNWYALSKIQGEECIQLFRNDFEVTVCRPFAIYGEKQEARLIPNLIRSVRQQQTITLQPAKAGVPDGGLRLSLCHVDDAANALAKMALEGGVEVLNLAGSEAFTLEEVANILGKKLGIEPIFQLAPNAREGDLVSEPSAFNNYFARDLIPFETGADRLIQDHS